MASKTSFISEAQQVAQLTIEVGDRITSLLRHYNDLGSTGAFSGTDPVATARGDEFTGNEFVDGIAALQAASAAVDTNRVNLRRIAG